MMLAVCLAISSFPPVSNAQATPVQKQSGPAESVYLQLASVGLDPSRVFKVRSASLDRSSIHITLEDGTIAFTKDVMGKVTGAFFEGDGELLLRPPTDVERRSMSLFTGMAILEERFSTAYFRFNDGAASELQPGLRAPEEAEEFANRWDATARNLAHDDAMRLLATFSDLLPTTSETSKESSAGNSSDPDDHMMHVRLYGTKLGIFDVFYDSTAEEQIEAGQIRTSDNGNVYYDVWTSFSINEAGPAQTLQQELPQKLPKEAEPRGDRLRVRSYVIDAEVKPPKELDAEVKLQLDAVRGGSRFLVFELSRYLHVQTVEVDGRVVEFIQNPAVEGSRLARAGNDLVAVILPKPAPKGQKLSLRFVYSGEVLAEAGKGLLYVGARGEWYPNRGLDMADYDLTFHYPVGWTLLATGKPVPVSFPPSAEQTQPQNVGDQQVARWVSERPIPIAGFNLGKYVRAEAKAGNVSVETYATAGVERDFPSPRPQPVQPETQSRHSPIVPEAPLIPPSPSPAHNAMAVAEATAQAIRFYADRFGPFPYSQLALTQMPGRESQGWPGLIFLSSYAFLNRQEREDLHINPTGALIEQQVPAHETAHQWWGDLVTWRTYHDQWFSEGLANYCSLMMLQEKNPADFRLVMEKYRKDLADKNQDAGPVTLGGRLLSSRFPQGYEAISYGRATWLFHMLRSMLQDAAEDGEKKESSQRDLGEPFVRSLRKIRERYQGKSITTRELFDAFAEDLPSSLRYEGKPSLDWFVNGWINGTSLPRLELESVKLIAKPNATVVTGMIRQKEAPEDLVTSVPIYAVVSGKTPVFLRRVFADGAETSFHLTAPAGTHKLLLDPNGTVLTAPK
jgi:peptidase M1-like protein